MLIIDVGIDDNSYIHYVQTKICNWISMLSNWQEENLVKNQFR